MEMIRFSNSLNTQSYGYYSNVNRNTENATQGNKPNLTAVSGTDIKQNGVGEVQNEPCQTCANRKYVDGSNDPGVSFKSPAHISPQAAMSSVTAHEYEHVQNRRAEAQREGKEIVSQNVNISTSVCPECGRVYVSGGKTTTVTASKAEPIDKGAFFDQYA